MAIRLVKSPAEAILVGLLIVILGTWLNA